MTTEKIITLWIDGFQVSVPEKTTILEAAASINIRIPSLCYHPDLSVVGACRVCLVEVEGQRNPVPACSFPVSEGMKVTTSSVLLRRLRRDVVELILDNHPQDCQTCMRNLTCELQRLALELGVWTRLFEGERKTSPVDVSGPGAPQRREVHPVRALRRGCAQRCRASTTSPGRSGASRRSWPRPMRPT